MKWVVGSVAVLFAFVMGVSVGWLARAHQSVARAPIVTAAPPTYTATTTAPPPPPIAKRAPIPWVEDSESFAWPKSPAHADIVAVDATHYLVRRAYLDKILADQSTLMREARIVPAYEDGKPIGIKIFGVRPTSMLARLGLQNGDTLQTMNGLPLASPDDALEAYTHMRVAKKLVLHLERRGAPLDLHYRIDDA